jgi:iron(III) transport system substrate-binding protein
MARPGRSKTALAALIAVLALIAAACGAEDVTQPTSDATAPDDGAATQEPAEPGDDGDDLAALYEAAQQEGTMVWYVSSPLESTEAIVGDFEAQYPGVDVQVERIVGLAQYERFLQEEQAGQHMADMIQISDKPAVEDLIDRGFIAQFTPPTDDRFEEGSYKISGYSYVPWRTTVAVMYNTDNVSEQEAELLTDWNGILDERWSGGRIAMRAAQVGAGYAPLLYWLTDGADEYGEGYMEALAAQEPVIYPDPVQAGQAVVAGEQDVWFTGWESFAVAQYEAGAPIRWAFPDRIPAYGNVWTAISANAQHPNAAQLFFTWLLNEDGAESIQDKYKERAALEGVEDNRAVTQEPWYEDPDDIIWVPDTEAWAEHQPMVQETWVRHFGRLGAQ